MTDRQPLHPGRVKLVPVAGQENVYDMVRADEALVPGTELKKATLLSDDTAAMFGMGSEAVPNDIFNFLGIYNQHHWWRLLHGQAYSYFKEKLTKVTALTTIIGSYTSVDYSKSIEFEPSSGEPALVDPVTLKCGYGSVADVEEFLQTLCNAAPIYMSAKGNADESTIYYIPAGATYTSASWGSAAYTFCGWFNTSTDVLYVRLGYPSDPSICASIVGSERVYVEAGDITYVHSADRSAYPDIGTVDNITYKYLGIPFQNAIDPGTTVKIEALYEYTVPSSVESVAIPMNNIDWSKYDQVLVDHFIQTDDTTLGTNVRINGTTNTDQNSIYFRYSSGDPYYQDGRITSTFAGGHRRRIRFQVFRSADTPIMLYHEFEHSFGVGSWPKKTYAEFETLVFSPGNSGKLISAGCTVKIYGVQGVTSEW